MTDSITSLHPREVWQHFYHLTQIPRVSGNEGGVRRYLQEFAASCGLAFRTDTAGNAIITSPAYTAGAGPAVILQAHMDMVGVCMADLNFDFAHQAIQAYVDNGFVRAKGTTLGADNGIGLAVILALLADERLRTLRLKAIFTTEEETTMRGARGLTRAELDGDYLLNLDSEENGFLYVSCAGSENCEITMALQPQSAPPGHVGFDIELSGLSGGHSGVDIHKGRGNAIVILATILRHLQWPWLLGNFSGGTVRNAIPSHARVRLAAEATLRHLLPETLSRAFADCRRLHARTDPDMQLSIRPAAPADGETFCSPEAASHLTALITAMPQGPLRMSDLDPGVTETSLNLGVIRTDGGRAVMTTMHRSLCEEGLAAARMQLTALLELTGGVSWNFDGRCPCWQSPPDSRLIRVLQQHYHEQTGRQMRVTAMHAGLECAFFVRENAQLQIASLGPSIISPHSPQERVDIKGVGELYDTVRSALLTLA